MERSEFYLSFRIYSRIVSNTTDQNYSLAYAEMRSILTRVIWNFDMALVKPEENWIDGNGMYGLWDKKPLNVYLTPRKDGKTA